jgi:Ca-activated chloride channel family protein
MKIHTKLDRALVPSLYPSAPTITERYLQVQIVAPDNDRPSHRLPVNLALVIDRSGSMAGTKLEKAREAAIECIKQLTADDRAAVIAYDDTVRIVAPSRAMIPAAKARLISEINSIQSGGSTNLAGGWLTGAQEIANYTNERDYLSRVILLSDGLANVGIVDPEELARHATELRLRGISTTTMGIGVDFDEALMDRLALAGGGHFYFIEHSSQLRDYLHRELGEVMSICARNVELEMVVPENVHAHIMNSFEAVRTAKTFRVRLDDMLTGEVRSIVFKLTVRPGREGGTLPISLTLSYTDVATGERRTISGREAVLTYASEEGSRQEAPDPEVMREVALLEGARAREEALHFDAQGNYAASANRLAAAAAQIRSMAPASPEAAAEADLLEQSGQQAAQGMTQGARKNMYYDHSTRRHGQRK